MEARVGKKRKIFSFYKPTNCTSFEDADPPSNAAETSNHADEQNNNCQRTDFDLSVYVVLDPALRTPIWQCPVNEKDAIRRVYNLRGPYQPVMKFSQTRVGGQNRQFHDEWYNEFPWLEYSPDKDAAFCFPCFVFQEKKARYPTFTPEGFRSWKRVKDGSRCPFLIHVGGPTSPHSNAVQSMGLLMNATGHIDKVMNAQMSEEVKKNRLRVTTTIESIRWLCLQACAMRGHDEYSSSKNRGNFLEMIKFIGKMNVDIDNIILDKAPGNAMYTSPDIQKNILHIIAERVRKNIRDEVGSAKFYLLVDESKDIADKEQMAIVLRFVDREGFLRERFFDIVEVADTTALTLKQEISNVLGRHVAYQRYPWTGIRWS